MRQAADDLFFLEPIGDRDLNGSVKGKLAAIDLLQRLVGFDQHKVVFQQLGAETTTSFFDPFGQLDLLLVESAGDLAHLGQVHANRIVGP